MCIREYGIQGGLGYFAKLHPSATEGWNGYAGVVAKRKEGVDQETRWWGGGTQITN